MEAEGKVARAGLQAFAKVKIPRMILIALKRLTILNVQQRMAGIVAGLGALTTGYVTMEENKKTRLKTISCVLNVMHLMLNKILETLKQINVHSKF